MLFRAGQLLKGAMTDNVFTKFLERQHTEGRTLAANSDILKLMPVAGAPPQQYIAEFRCQGVIQDRDGRVVPGDCSSLEFSSPTTTCGARRHRKYSRGWLRRTCSTRTFSGRREHSVLAGWSLARVWLISCIRSSRSSCTGNSIRGSMSRWTNRLVRGRATTRHDFLRTPAR